jgi:putative transposase
VSDFREKKHRLPEAAYRGRRTVSITACVEGRRRLFQDEEAVGAMVDILRHWCSETVCLVPIYCFMPDHMHLLIQGIEERSQPKRAMDGFKVGAGLWVARNRPRFELQKDYHDHIVRTSDDWRRHAFYVFHNPVRAGLVEDPCAYPFTGTIGFDLKEMLMDAAW